MLAVVPSHLAPRKKPRQARSEATLDVVFEATIQVLITVGPHRLTTTQVAKRAGVSVGTMYQYFPHKQALFYALNARYLDSLAAKIEATCRAHHGVSIDMMIEALVTAYWNAKNERPDATRALYRSAVELDNEALLATFGRRVDAATAGMFTSASDIDFSDLPAFNMTLLTTIFGVVRSVFERNLPDMKAEAVREQLVVMCRSYSRVVNQTSASS